MKMRNAALSMSLSLLSHACRVGLPVAVAASCMVACDDENDPKTWVKRLDDAAQRGAAIKRLDEMFNGAMSSANSNREDPKVKGIIDDAAEPLTKVYTTQQLDEKTRKDVMKLIADMGDPRGTPAFAKAFKDYEPGKNDEDVKFAAQGTARLSTQNKLTDQGLIDALWDCFSKFKLSQAKSSNLYLDLQMAVKTVKHPTWGPKAVALLSTPIPTPVTPDISKDYIIFWQQTAAQLLGELKFTGAVGPLVKALMTPTKAELKFPVRNALHKMAKEAEPELIKALKGEGDYQKLAEAYPERSYLPLIAEPIAYIGRPSGLAAIIEQLADTKLTPQNRVALTSYLTYWPADAKVINAYKDSYTKVPADVPIAAMGGGNGHAILVGAAALFFDSSLTDWIVKEYTNAKGMAADEMPRSALPAAIKLMTAEQTKMVNDAVNKISGPASEKEMFKSASAILDKCKKDDACYLSVLDTPVPSSPLSSKYGHIKAVWMATMNKGPDTKAKLLERLEKVKDGDVRLYMIEAIDILSPQGDPAAADKLDKIVETDSKAKVPGTDEMYRIALKLRSKVP
ncbi:MAG: hypothetical protein KIT84_02370 [Labilithrix sp.]|nr:hypothetical protein [Labilithrix sp.]MCW5809830.1 hypothetical protein [Labilithrix sp.]